ncbi:cytochrome P450 CYP82D47-like [Coffea eugenioides]|uniref:Strychnine-10-hydroxylase-like n=1 Tax=Coffea arabica TaxID=13443 RepID=A0A6P6URT8_COFAR|nr:cytochrome P450 CYP82D47-like [Coffea arabica]XP_027147982.1 cytochrome P450 CYP82D47-like [Coffea eugenioides]
MMEWSFQHLNAAAVGLLAFSFFLVYFFFNKDAKKHGSVPPEAGGAWPIIGHLHLLGRGPEKLPHITLAALAEKYGPAFTIRLGVHKNLVVSSWELAKEIFTTHDLAAASRPNSLASELLSYDYASFGFAPYGDYWREMRKVISIELLSTKRLELLKHVRISETDLSTKDLYNLWNSSSGPVLVEMKQWFADLNLNVILRMVVGKRFFGATDVSEEKEAKLCQKVMREFFYLTGLFVLADSVPYLRWLDWGGYERKMKVNAQEMDRLADGWLKEHRRKKQSGEATNDHQDFMDVMLSLTEGADFSASYDADTITKATCLGLISGGSDTTVVMLTWTLSLIMNNPRVLKTAQEELDLHVGKERRVTESDISNLVYLQAIIKETLRLYPPGPLGGTRELSEDCIIGGYHIPKGTRVILNMWKIQRDPNVWHDGPLEFRPERFLTTHKHIDVKGYHFELIPFGAGRRICPGINLGLQMLRLVLANLLHAFDLSTPSNEPVDMTESAGLTNIKATPLQLLVAPRLPPHLYS